MAANGDAKAFSKLYETLYREMYYTAYYSVNGEADADRAVLGTVKDGFAAIGRLHSELSFKVFMMKSLCARIKLCFKEYNADKKNGAYAANESPDAKAVFAALEYGERLTLALYTGGRFSEEEAAAFTGLTTGAVRKRLARAIVVIGTDMTAERLHRLMTVKVIPEKLVPQNIVSFLMDENAELPELDAFTFLNRLRALGIGSADFIDLLKGCDAPEEAIERVSRNPAMNLQSLIVTLNGAGLTAKDYTRMLYTARQLWEHTVTMRIESIRGNAEGFQGNELYEDEYADTVRGDTPGYNNADTVTDTQSSAYRTDNYDGYEVARSDGNGYEDTQSDGDSYDDTQGDGGYDDTQGDDSGYDDSLSDDGYDDTQSDDSGYDDTQSDDSGYDDMQSGGNNAAQSDGESISGEFSSFNPTATFAAIDIDELKRAINGSYADSEEKPAEKEPPSSETTYIPITGGYHSGAITTWAAGAAVLFALSAVISGMEFEKKADFSDPVYAESAEDIFGCFYSSYNSDIIGGAAKELTDSCTVLGEMLIEHSRGLGTFAADGFAYAADAGGIEVYSLEGLTYAGEITPPKGTEFFRVFVREDTAYAVFEGEYCGFMALSGSEPGFTAVQSGTLTDMAVDGDTISFGSVYVPEFTESFLVGETEKYLPYISAKKDKISPQNVLLGGEGCGFAVSAEYSLKDGRALSEKAVMCAPIFASADGSVTAAENAVISVSGDEITVTQTDKLLCCAYENGLFAAYEENETEKRVVLRGEDMQPVSGINNFSGAVTALRLKDGILYVYGGDGILAASDCSDISKPELLSLNKMKGTITGDYAVCASRTDNGLEITAYDKDGEAAKYQKLLTESERETLEFSDSRAVIAKDGTFGLAYEWFDGVCKVSEYALFGKENGVCSLYDDKKGYTAAVYDGDRLCLISGAGIYYASDPPDTPYR